MLILDNYVEALVFPMLKEYLATPVRIIHTCHSLIYQASLNMFNTCFIHKKTLLENHHIGPWFEGFIFIKDCTGNTSSKDDNRAWGEQVVLLCTNSLARRVASLAVASCFAREASSGLAAPPIRHSYSPWRAAYSRGELWQSSTCIIGVFDPKTSKPNIHMHNMTLEDIENL
jgi:hypothetical protein